MAKLETLKQLFEGKIFRIPDYQRGYSWQDDQLDDLWDDLKETQGMRKNHFLGVITCNSMTDSDMSPFQNQHDFVEITEDNKILLGNEKYTPYFIVDGQQRVTTLLILISVIVAKLKKNKAYEAKANEWESLYIKKSNLYKLDYNNEPKNSEYLYATFNQSSTTDTANSHSMYVQNLSNALDYFSNKINTEEDSDLDYFMSVIEEKFLFYFFEINPNELNISLVFETMNNRGIPLSKLELFKNRLLYLIDKNLGENKNLKDKVLITWNTMYEWLGRSNQKHVPLKDDEFLKAFYIMYFDHKNEKEDELNDFEYGLFKEIYSTQTTPKYEELRVLLNSLKSCSKLWYIINYPLDYKEEINTDESITLSNEILDLLYTISLNPNSSFSRPLIMAALCRLNKNSEDEQSVIGILKELERHNFVVYLLAGRSSNTNRVNILRNVYSYFSEGNKDVHSTITGATTNSIKEKEIIDNIWKITQQKQKYFYSWAGCKYFMWNWECYLKENSNSQEIDEPTDFKKGDRCLIFYKDASKKDFPEVWRNRDVESIKKLRYSLGNITFSRSPKTKDSFKDNKRFYQVSKSYTDRELTEYPEWTDKAIYERGKKMFDFLLERWELKNTSIDSPEFMKKFLIEKVTLKD